MFNLPVAAAIVSALGGGAVYTTDVASIAALYDALLDPVSIRKPFSCTQFGSKWHWHLSENPKTLRSNTGCGRRLDHVEIREREIVFADDPGDICEPCLTKLKNDNSRRELFIGERKLIVVGNLAPKQAA